MVCPLCKRSYCVDWKIDLQMQISAHVVKEGNSSESSALQLIYEEKNMVAVYFQVNFTVEIIKLVQCFELFCKRFG